MGTNIQWCLFMLCASFAVTFAASGYFTPRSYYVIDKNGEKSDVVYLTPRVKRELFDKLHVIRKRSTDISNPKCKGLSSSVSIAGSGSSSGSGFGSGFGSNPGASFGSGSGGSGYADPSQNFIPGPPPEFLKFFETFFNTFPSAAQFGSQYVQQHNNIPNFGQDLASRFGGGEELVDSGEVDNVPGISVNANAKGNKGAWSSSSTSIDSNGKATYETRSGKVDK
ncbi:uncharacterized protein LOC123297829 isoform X2 [Chrysoperla carnea]|uniref:uncharacterized protein LOC123297829 isoform X2 n=1 Tax=Chrysoperla carnea TaxID=189513 RepID=UPI001D0837FE|nr:uncharacterized protein LOC123297829 isoform X2 [Chrysoperla carnea]